MKANELRIGNLVQRNGEIFEADHITILMAHNYQPIPITPIIMENAGFKNTKTNFKIHFSEVTQKISDKPIFEQKYYLSFKGRVITIEYAHQLQNLFFALTGEELNIKL